MSSRKEVFEQYLGQMGLNKTVLEAVKDINNVLFEGLDDLLAEYDEPVISSVPEVLPGETPVPSATAPATPTRKLEKNEEEFDPNKEYTTAELESKLKIPYNKALQRAIAWAHTQDDRFEMLWNDWGGVDKIAFMRDAGNGTHVFFSAERILYEITAKGEDGVPMFTYETATNPVRMSKDVYERISQYYEDHKGIGVGDLTEIPFEDIRRLVLGIGVHPTGEEAPNIGVPCKVEVVRDATLLARDADDHDAQTGIITPNPEVRNALKREYGLPVECVTTVMIKEWCDSSDRYRMDASTGIVYDISRKSVARAVTSTDEVPEYSMKKKQTNSLTLDWKMIDWAKTQDMFKLLLQPDASGVRKLINTSTIHRVPNNGNIEGITGNAPYVYMDDENYNAYVANTPNFDQSTVMNFDANALNTIVRDEFNSMSTSDASATNSYGYDKNGWVSKIECELAESGSGIYKLKDGVAAQIKNSYARSLTGSDFNNYIAGKNIIKIGGTLDADGNLTGAYNCHPLVRLVRTGSGFVAKLVAVFDDSCCNPNESLEKIVGTDGLRGGKPTIMGFARILDRCNLAKQGEFQINECVLSNVDISKSTGYISIGAYTSGKRLSRDVPQAVKTTIKNTVIAVGNNGADQVLPNNRIGAEVAADSKIRGLTIYNSDISDSTIENGYAYIESCTIENLHMSNAGSKYLKDWHPGDASNVVFKGDNMITVKGSAKYRVGYTKALVPNARGTKRFADGDVTTQLTGTVVLDSTSGQVICAGSALHNVVAHGPCKIRTSNLKGMTIGVNADAGGNFKMTDVCGVDTNPANADSALSIEIEHGMDEATVLGDPDRDSEHGSIILSGKVYIEGGAKIFHSAVESPDAEQVVYVRGNMKLNGCSPYTLNQRDSGLISERIHSDNTVLSGDCSDVATVSSKTQVSLNSMGSDESTNPFNKYEKFKVSSAGQALRELTLYNAESLIEDFLKNNPNSVTMNSSVFMDITDNKLVPKPELKMTIWDPTGAFFVGVVNNENNVVHYGRMIMLKCPNVRLNHSAIIQKKKDPVYNLDYDMYALGKVTLRQYVEFLKHNGFTDCYDYLDSKGKVTTQEQEFIQICLLSNKDKQRPRDLSEDAVKALYGNNIRKVTAFKLIDTSKSGDIRDVDGYYNITSVYTRNDGSMSIETPNSSYYYSIPIVDDKANKITCNCEKKWIDDDGKTKHERYPIDCRTDEMYKAGYARLVEKSLSSNAEGLARIKNALSGNPEGLRQRDALSASVNALNGQGMKANPDEMLADDAYNKLVNLLRLDEGEKVYVLSYKTSAGDEIKFMAAGKLPKTYGPEAMRLKNAGCRKMVFRKISYDKKENKFHIAPRVDARITPVKFMNDIRYSPVIIREYMLARDATTDDFIKLLGVPKSMVL